MAVALVEMGRHLVEQQQRDGAAHRRLHPGAGQHDADQQRLLFPGRAYFRRHSRRRGADRKIAPVRPDRRAAGLGVGGPGRNQRFGEPFLRRKRRSGVQPVLDRAVGPQRGGGKRSGPVRRSAGYGRRRFAPDRRYGHAAFRHRLFQSPQPCPIAATVPEQPGAGAHGPLIGPQSAGMAGIDTKHEAVEEAPPGAGAITEQPVHGRRQPKQADDFTQRRRSRRRQAVDPDDAPVLTPAAIGRRRSRVVALAGLLAAAPPGADIESALGRQDFRRHRPSTIAAVAVDLGQPRPAQAPAGRQIRNRLQEVGLTGAVGTGKHHGPCVGLKLKPRITTIVAQAEPRYRQLRDDARVVGKTLGTVQLTFPHTRMGINT